MNNLPIVKCVSIPMSYVSSLIDKHPYKDRWNETRNVFRRYNSIEKKATLQDEAESPLYKDILANHNQFLELFVNSVKICDLQREADQLLSRLCQKHNVDFRSHRMLFTKKRGYVLEKVALELYGAEYKVSVMPVVRQTVYLDEKSPKLLRDETDDTVMRLIGKADGRDSDGHILEVKCRRSGFREFFFERLQLATYVLSYGLPGRLVELFEGELRVSEMSKDEAHEIWDDAYPKLLHWRKIVEGFMTVQID